MGWLILLSEYPQYADFLGNWHIFDDDNYFSADWCILLEKQPAFKDKCDCLHLKNDKSATYYLEYLGYWDYVFWSAPLFDFKRKYHSQDHYRADANLFFNDYKWLEEIFLNNPKHCYDIADSYDWCNLLCRRPQLASWCDWKNFSGFCWFSLNSSNGRILNHYQTSTDVRREMKYGF